MSELAAHYEYERNLLSNSQAVNKRPAAVQALAKIVDRPRFAKRTEASNLLSRVRTNRESRRNNRLADDEVQAIDECPICGLRLSGIGMTVNEHVSACLDMQVQEDRSSQQDGWDIYEVAGQTRVRAIGMLEGGVRSIPGAAVATSNEEVDVFVDVEGDAEAVYGRPQYTEADLVNPTAAIPTGKPSGGIIQSRPNGSDPRCNVCLSAYCTPVISVQCFHTYCEKCWLQALQSQKLCPHCRLITQPSDLRRIYL